MQAIWSDYGDIKVPLYSPGDEGYDPLHPEHNYTTVTELHNGEAGPGAWLNRWYDVPASNDDGTMGYDHVCRLAISTFDYDRVQWVDSSFNSPYKSWPQPATPPETWDFYRIRPGCHAYTQISGESELLTDQYKNAVEWRLDKPMFIKTTDLQSNKRVPDNSVVIMLEVGWAKRSKTPEGIDAGLVEWKYEYLHFLTASIEALGPSSESSLRNTYDLLTYGQSLSTIVPSTAPSNEHEIQWINMHIYNAGSVDLYCPGISLWAQ